MSNKHASAIAVIAPIAALVLGYTTSASFGRDSGELAVRIFEQRVSLPAASPEDEAASFAARAAASVGLVDSHGRFAEYQETRPVSQAAWEAGFATASCLGEPCEMGTRLKFTIEEIADHFRVVAVEGPASEEDRAQLLAYQEASQPPIGWSFPSVEFNDSGRITGSPVWEGSINPVGIGSKCTPRVINDVGVELWRGTPFDLAPPGAEEERAGEGVAFSALTAELQTETPDVECEQWRGTGWRADGPAQARRHDDDAPGPMHSAIAATARLQWPNGDPPFAHAITECTVVVRDEAGRELGKRSETFPGPASERGAPRRPAFAALEMAVLVPVPEPAAARAADVKCHLITPDDFETGGSA